MEKHIVTLGNSDGLMRIHQSADRQTVLDGMTADELEELREVEGYAAKKRAEFKAERIERLVKIFNSIGDAADEICELVPNGISDFDPPQFHQVCTWMARLETMHGEVSDTIDQCQIELRKGSFSDKTIEATSI